VAEIAAQFIETHPIFQERKGTFSMYFPGAIDFEGLLAKGLGRYAFLQ